MGTKTPAPPFSRRARRATKSSPHERYRNRQRRDAPDERLGLTEARWQERRDRAVTIFKDAFQADMQSDLRVFDAWIMRPSPFGLAPPSKTEIGRDVWLIVGEAIDALIAARQALESLDSAAKSEESPAESAGAKQAGDACC